MSTEEYKGVCNVNSGATETMSGEVFMINCVKPGDQATEFVTGVA